MVHAKLLTLLAAATLLTACFDVTRDGINGGQVGFLCRSADDCVEGFGCNIPANSPDGLGVCQKATSSQCYDGDSDGFFAGIGCESVDRADCDDTNPQVSPGGVEVCNGIDDNCDGEIDANVAADGSVNPMADGERYRECPKQIGICSGARVECTDGAFPACVTGNGYPANFEPNETSCDGIDNDCDAAADEDCECVPGSVSTCVYTVLRDDVERTAVGQCERGLQFCINGVRSECLAAPAVANAGALVDCSADRSVCGAGSFCVDEALEPNEDLADGCERVCGAGEIPAEDNCVLNAAATTCTRSVCRTTQDAGACTDDAGCDNGFACVQAVCRRINVAPTDELCNGLDDNCDGMVDNKTGISGAEVCSQCPFNMVKVEAVTPSGAAADVCVDLYEASRPDATSDDQGQFGYHAQSVAGVLPWTGVTAEEATAACQGEDYYDYFKPGPRPIKSKRLCSYFEYEQACGGVNGDPNSDYAYPYSTSRAGDQFVAGACNDASSADGLQPTGTSTCGFDFQTAAGDIVTTYDMVGNAAEWVRGPGSNLIAGGSYLETPSAATRTRSGSPTRSGPVLSCTDLSLAPAAADSAEDIGFRCCTAVTP